MMLPFDRRFALAVNAATARATYVLIGLFALSPFTASAFRGLQPGDLLVATNTKVLRVDPISAAVLQLSPPPSSVDPNLLSSAAGVAVDPDDGTIFVASAGTNKLIAIAPGTGVQREVEAISGGIPTALDIGSYPQGVDVSNYKPPGGARSIYVGAYQALYRIDRMGADISSTALITGSTSIGFPFISIQEAGGGVLDGVWLSGGTQGLAKYKASDGTVTSFSISSLYTGGVDYGPILVYTGYDNSCSQAGAGVFGVLPPPIATGGNLWCPYGVVVNASGDTIFVSDGGGPTFGQNPAPPSVVKIFFDGSQWIQSLLAQLPPNESPLGITIYTPEPGSVALGATGTAVLAVLAGYRRPCRRSRRRA